MAERPPYHGPEALLNQAPPHVLDRYIHAKKYGGPFTMAEDFFQKDIPLVDRDNVLPDDIRAMILGNEERMQRFEALGSKKWGEILYEYIRPETAGRGLMEKDFATYTAFFNEQSRVQRDPDALINSVYFLIGQYSGYTTLQYRELESLFKNHPNPRRSVMFAEAHGLIARYRMKSWNPPEGEITHDYGYYDNPHLGFITDPRLNRIISPSSYDDDWDFGRSPKPKPQPPDIPPGGILLELPTRVRKEEYVPVYRQEKPKR